MQDPAARGAALLGVEPVGDGGAHNAPDPAVADEAFPVRPLPEALGALRQPLPTHLQIAEALAVPSRLVGRVIKPLLDDQLLVELRSDETAYMLGAPLEKISCQDIIEALRAGGGQELETRDDATRALVRGEFEKIQNAESASASRITLKDLVTRTPDPNAPNPPSLS